MQSIYPQRAPCSQTSAPQAWPSIPSVHSSPSTPCTDLILPGHGKHWIPQFPSQSQHILLLTTSFPCSWLPALSITASKPAKPQKWKDGAITARGDKVTGSWGWEERLGLVMDVQICSLHSAAEEGAPWRFAALMLFLPTALLKLVSVSKEHTTLKDTKLNFLQAQTICVMTQWLRRGCQITDLKHFKDADFRKVISLILGNITGNSTAKLCFLIRVGWRAHLFKDLPGLYWYWALPFGAQWIPCLP